MPLHNGFLPHEEFKADTVLKIIRNTALNPKLLLPIILLARFTKKGEDLSILHLLALSRIKTLFYIGIARVPSTTLLDASERDIRFTFDVNTLAHYWIVREFLPLLIKADHGMVVTVASVAAWVTVPNMVDYSASKAASQSFHEGLAAELKTRYGAPRVRTVVVNQGYTRTPLFTGYHNDSPWLMPALGPQTVADAIVCQVLSGTSGQLLLPANETIMTKFAGRKVVEDVDKSYETKEPREADVGASAVLVPPQAKE
ncbi:hypothetical protein B0T26DRAFT_746004 [Lasiosphaeria miniovina]|uniref:Uncharacterized protein n=1 Tax=Lasiosphaeria miniovina TaxID=1954250 RepID=A0AA40ED77_9PEZI|nr:uncharacterized protein B0T26DRAFT_746004 [Lasiosphaeria miniovina]KAK0734047.1 hypothetical protein B0T26DRAFT_746004 [Lasiosphaeria miniovina]